MCSNNLTPIPRSTRRNLHPLCNISRFHTNLKSAQNSMKWSITIFFQPSFGSKSLIDAAPCSYGFHTTTSLIFSRWSVKTNFVLWKICDSKGAFSYTRSVGPMILTIFESSVKVCYHQHEFGAEGWTLPATLSLYVNPRRPSIWTSKISWH